jgi:hypothetical protein
LKATAKKSKSKIRINKSVVRIQNVTDPNSATLIPERRKKQNQNIKIRNSQQKIRNRLKFLKQALQIKKIYVLKGFASSSGTVPVRMNDPQRSVQNHHHSHQLGSNLNKREHFLSRSGSGFFWIAVDFATLTPVLI